MDSPGRSHHNEPPPTSISIPCWVVCIVWITIHRFQKMLALEPRKRCDFLNCSSETEKTLKHGKFVLFIVSSLHMHILDLYNLCLWCHTLLSDPRRQQYMQQIWIMFLNEFTYSHFGTHLCFCFVSLPFIPAAVSSAICSLKHLFFPFHPMLITVNSQSLPATHSYEHVLITFNFSPLVILCYAIDHSGVPGEGQNTTFFMSRVAYVTPSEPVMTVKAFAFKAMTSCKGKGWGALHRFCYSWKKCWVFPLSGNTTDWRLLRKLH